VEAPLPSPRFFLEDPSMNQYPIDSLYEPCIQCDGKPVYRNRSILGTRRKERVLTGAWLNGRFYEAGEAAPLCPEHSFQRNAA
jgi:hypothetical protein